jgi:hypothetical protein
MATNNAVNENIPLPGFSAYKSATTANATGDATAVDFIADQELFDNGSCYDHTTGVFAAPLPGKYLLTATVCIDTVTVGHTAAEIKLVNTTSGNVLATGLCNPYNSGSAAGVLSLDVNATPLLAQGDNVKVVVTVSNSTKTVGIVGTAAADIRSWFTGFFIFMA